MRCSFPVDPPASEFVCMTSFSITWIAAASGEDNKHTEVLDANARDVYAFACSAVRIEAS
jgi:hypothetical protein